MTIYGSRALIPVGQEGATTLCHEAVLRWTAQKSRWFTRRMVTGGSRVGFCLASPLQIIQ